MKLLSAFLILVSLFFSRHSYSSEPSENYGKQSVGIGFGQVVLSGNFQKSFSDSFGGSLYYEYRSSDMFGIFAELGYSKHIDATGRNTLILKDLNPNLKINFSYFDELTVYGVGGFGLYHVNRTVFPASGSVTTFGFDAGPGFDLNLSNQFRFGALITFHHLFTKADPEAYNPAGGGMEIGGTLLKLMMNVRYVF